jgi:type II secretory pathway component PulM
MLNKIASGFAALAESPISLPVRAIANDWRETLARVAFALFVGGLIALLVLLYSGVAIV